jgi:hypothetical protein
MQRVLFYGFSAVALSASLIAWHWRGERIATLARNGEAAAKVQRAIAQPVPPPRSPPAGQAIAPVALSPAKPVQPDFRAAWEAMDWSAVAARRAQDPKLRALFVRKLRLEQLLKNGAFMRGYNLSHEDRERLLSAWVEYDLWRDQAPVIRKDEIDLVTPEFKAAFKAVDDRVREQIRAVEVAVLGEEGSSALQSYARTQGMRDFVGILEAQATLGGFALTAEQSDAMVAVLVNSQGGQPVYAPDQVNLDAAAQQLAPLLSRQQLDLLLLSLGSRVASIKLKKVASAVAAPPAPGTAAPSR